MNVDWAEWINLALRWLHLVCGIAWIGSSFYFIWLDNHLKPPKEGDASGELWSVHGGGFYHNMKYNVAPAKMPEELHWFKWEAYFTWMSGFALLVVIYYWGAQAYLLDPAKADLAPWQAIAIGIGSLVLGWFVYDGLCRSPLKTNNAALGVIWFAYLVLAAFVLGRLFSDRAAYIHVGAMVGTAMAVNVFFVIIPNQRKVVADLIAGRAPDPALGKMGKQRSLHNNYMTLPVLFIMISQHYPMTYGAERPWLVLALLAATGVAVRQVFNLRHAGKPTEAPIFVAIVLAVLSVTYVTSEKRNLAPPPPAAAGAASVTYASVEPILAQHCSSCHAAAPTDPAFSAPPLGLVLDSYAHARAAADRIEAMAVDSEAMPLGNMTAMTLEERQTLGAWIAAGAPQ